MKVCIKRLLTVPIMLMLPYFLSVGCSSAQQEDGDLAAEDGQYNEEGNSSGEDEYGEEGGDEYGSEGNYGEEGGNEVAGDQYSEDYNDYEGEEELAEDAQLNNELLAGEETKSDLENIIAGENADQVEDVPEQVADVPAELPVNNAAAGEEMAAPLATAGGLPQLGSKMPYVVRVGETLSGIAEKIYGRSDMWQEMATLSAISNPDLVKPGDVVYYQLKEESLAFATAYEGAVKEQVVVKPGDTLARIAQSFYGNQGDWKFVWRQNSIPNPDRLEVGQTLYVVSPASLSAALNYVNSLTVAELLEDVTAANAMDTQMVDVDQSEMTTQTDNANNSLDQNIDQQVTGFQLAKSMFNTFANNIGMAG